MQVYADIVLNHRMGGDSTEIIKATLFSHCDRLNLKGGMREIKSYTHYTFPGRGGKYSKQVNGAVDTGDNFELRANGHRAEFERLNLGNFVLDVND